MTEEHVIIKLLMYSKLCLGRCYINYASCLIIQEHIRSNQAHTGADSHNSNKMHNFTKLLLKILCVTCYFDL